jgi:prepilin peptidase CpaA
MTSLGQVASLLALVLYVGFGIAAIVGDLRSLRIPNWISIGLLCLFAVHSAPHLGGEALAIRAALAAAVFAIGFGCWLLGIFGAGDVKLLAAYAPWLGPEEAGRFALVMLGLSIVLSSAFLVLRLWSGKGDPGDSRLARYARDGTVPFGVAIAGSGLSIVPLLFPSP